MLTSRLFQAHLSPPSTYPLQDFKEPITLLSCIQAVPRLYRASQPWEGSPAFSLGCPSDTKAVFASESGSQTLADCALGARTSLSSLTNLAKAARSLVPEAGQSWPQGWLRRNFPQVLGSQLNPRKFPWLPSRPALASSQGQVSTEGMTPSMNSGRTSVVEGWVCVQSATVFPLLGLFPKILL